MKIGRELLEKGIVPRQLRPRPKISKESFVYFFQRSDKAIKIGTSTSPTQRLATLQTASGPLEVLAMIPGDRNAERRLHRKFAEWRIHGEWFEPSEELLEFIGRCHPERLDK